MFPGLILGPFVKAAINRIEILALAGHDSISLDPSLTIPATIRGGAGNDSIVGGGGDDVIYGDAGIDTVLGGGGNDIILGGTDADYLYGGLGNDLLIGGAGSDWLYGEGGDDILIGGNGPSSLTDLQATCAAWNSGLSFNQRITGATSTS